MDFSRSMDKTERYVTDDAILLRFEDNCVQVRQYSTICVSPTGETTIHGSNINCFGSGLDFAEEQSVPTNLKDVGRNLIPISSVQYTKLFNEWHNYDANVRAKGDLGYDCQDLAKRREFSEKYESCAKQIIGENAPDKEGCKYYLTNQKLYLDGPNGAQTVLPKYTAVAIDSDNKARFNGLTMLNSQYEADIQFDTHDIVVNSYPIDKKQYETFRDFKERVDEEAFGRQTELTNFEMERGESNDVMSDDEYNKQINGIKQKYCIANKAYKNEVDRFLETLKSKSYLRTKSELMTEDVSNQMSDAEQALSL